MSVQTIREALSVLVKIDERKERMEQFVALAGAEVRPEATAPSSAPVIVDMTPIADALRQLASTPPVVNLSPRIDMPAPIINYTAPPAQVTVNFPTLEETTDIERDANGYIKSTTKRQRKVS